MENKILEAALAGLLHDIGKFAQRAGEETRGEWNESTIAEFKYSHALLTSRFAQYIPSQWKQIAQEAALHHRGNTDLSKCVLIADWLASGERSEYDDDSRREDHPVQMQSIFKSVVYTENGETQQIASDEKRIYLPLTQLKLEKSAIFPTDFEPDPWPKYQQLWEGFIKKVEKLKEAHEPDGNLGVFIESFLYLLQDYTWCVPAAYRNYKADVSLFHHNKMTAALATILASPEFDPEVLKELQRNPQVCESEIALLIGGDLSGVQDFIYPITNKGATSALRGRSFYLQLLTEAAARLILRELGLPITNLTYASGGNFYLFARISDQDKLFEIRRKISRILYHQHRGDLYLAVASIPIKGKDFFNSQKLNQHPFARKWFELGQKLALAKNTRFSELETDELQYIFTSEGQGGNQENECQVCGLEGEDWSKDDLKKDVRKCLICASYEQLGDELRYANYLAFWYPDIPAIPQVGQEKPATSYQETLASFGLEIKVAEEIGTINGAHLILALTDQAMQKLNPASKTAVGRRFLVNTHPLLSFKEANKYSTDEEIFQEGKIKPFSVLAEQSQGIKRLGILRMDVDNMGQIFAQGLQEATPSRMAALSFAISLYFEGWLAQIADQVNQDLGDFVDENTQSARRAVLYAIYSGGDDLFYVGAWDAVVELARRVRRELTPYSAFHPGMHISSGITLATAKYPLAKAAEEAHIAEAQAKSQEWWNGKTWVTKDVISFLGQATAWNAFGYQENDPGMNIFNLKQLLVQEINERSASRAVVQLLIRLFLQYNKVEKERSKRVQVK